ncbi:MAG: amidohydrolase family protein [Gammaproteobacteria bacterium]|nr:amidohydrolase family protein [Gammaproteobacteria bacterium]
MTASKPGIDSVDTMIVGATIVTMNSDRHVIRDGSIAMLGDSIVAVGKRADLDAVYEAKTIVDGRHFVVTPGFTDAHVHITGDPLTRGVRRGEPGMDFSKTLMEWVIPLFHAHEPHDEQVSAQVAALRMLHGGVTSFIEAGTVQHLDDVVEGLQKTGIRSRVGAWVEGRSFDSSVSETAAIDSAIETLEKEVNRFGKSPDARIVAWPLLIGHAVNPDEVWLAAKRLADDNDVGISAHMSPYASDPAWFLGNTGKRPIEHLADLGVLGENVSLTHVVYVSQSEVDILAETGTNVIFCPYAALVGGFGAASHGLFPEMARAGINIMLGSDGVAIDIMNSARLMSGFFKDARNDETLFPATEVLEMITLNGAKGMGLPQRIGAIEVGRKADIVCHDTDRLQWFPEFDVVEQLLETANGAGVHSVWVDGERVIEDYRSTKIDEDVLRAQARESASSIVSRTGMSVHHPWPVI